MPKYIVPYHIQFDQNACIYLIFWRSGSVIGTFDDLS
jgi:hypothetical protein